MVGKSCNRLGQVLKAGPSCGAEQPDGLAIQNGEGVQFAKMPVPRVPFVGQLKSGEGLDTVSAQLTTLINHYADQGWEFYGLDNVDIDVQPGCLGRLLGASTGYTTFNQVILRQEVTS